MSQRILSLVTAGLMAFATWLPGATLAEIKTVSLSVPTMNCMMCPITVRMALEKVAGVSEASADLETLSATVSFDTEETSVPALIEATTNAGYPSTLIQ